MDSTALRFYVERCKKLVAAMNLQSVAEFLNISAPGKSGYIETSKSPELQFMFADIFGVQLYRYLNGHIFIRKSYQDFLEGITANSFRESCEKALCSRYCIPAAELLVSHANFSKFRSFFQVAGAVGSQSFYNSVGYSGRCEREADCENLFSSLCKLVYTDDFNLVETLERSKFKVLQLFLYRKHVTGNCRSRSAERNRQELSSSRAGSVSQLSELVHSAVSEVPQTRAQKLSLSTDEEEIWRVRTLICGTSYRSPTVLDCLGIFRRCYFLHVSEAQLGSADYANELELYGQVVLGRRATISEIIEALVYKRLEARLDRRQPVCDWYMSMYLPRAASLPRRPAATCRSLSVSGHCDYKREITGQDAQIKLQRAVRNALKVFPGLEVRKIHNFDCLELEVSKQTRFGLSARTISRVAQILQITQYAFDYTFTFAAFFQRPYESLTTCYGEISAAQLFSHCSYLHQMQCFGQPRVEQLESLLGAAPAAAHLTRLAKLASKLKLAHAEAIGRTLECIYRRRGLQQAQYDALYELFVELLYRQPASRNIADGLQLMVKALLRRSSVDQKQIALERSLRQASSIAQRLEREAIIERMNVLLGTMISTLEIDTVSAKFGYISAQQLQNLYEFVSNMPVYLFYAEAAYKANILLFGQDAVDVRRESDRLLQALAKQTTKALQTLRVSAFELLHDSSNAEAFRKCLDELVRLRLAGTIWRWGSVLDAFK